MFVAEEGIGGSRIAAAIVPQDALDWDALAAHARAKLEVRAPVRYYEVGALPRNATGKLLRDELAEWVTANGTRRYAREG